MSTSIYSINKGIGKSIEFRGLRAQYIWYFGGMVVALMLLFATLYIAGSGMILSLGLTGGLGALGGASLFRLSQRYGEHGRMKAMAKKRVPKTLRSYSRKFFQGLENKPYEQA